VDLGHDAFSDDDAPVFQRNTAAAAASRARAKPPPRVRFAPVVEAWTGRSDGLSVMDLAKKRGLLAQAGFGEVSGVYADDFEDASEVVCLHYDACSPYLQVSADTGGDAHSCSVPGSVRDSTASSVAINPDLSRKLLFNTSIPY
jgi:hypothetical protein